MSDGDFLWYEQDNAPTVGQLVCQLDELADSQISEFRFGEGKDSFPLMIFRQGEQLHAYVNKCPHHWLTMNRPSDGQFMMWSADELMCVHHCAVFKLNDGGRCTDGPCLGTNLVNVPVIVKEGQVLIGE